MPEKLSVHLQRLENSTHEVEQPGISDLKNALDLGAVSNIKCGFHDTRLVLDDD
jgi:hypothetical protein